MKKLNIIYDEWSEGELLPKCSGENFLGENHTRNILGLLTFYEFNNIKLCNFEEINSQENYFYFINHIPNIIDVLKILENTNHKVISYIKNHKNLFMVFLNEHESIDYENFKELINYLKRNQIPSNQIILVNNNPLLNNFKLSTNSNINVQKINFLKKLTAKNIVKFDNKFKYKKNKEGKFFLCHNRFPKEHRYVLLILMMKEGLLNDTNWSLIMGKHFIKNYKEKIGFLGRIIPKNDMEEYKEQIDYFFKLECKKSDFESEKNWFKNNELPWDEIFEMKTFENSYINITTESQYFDESIHISEKSIKPFYFYQIPIMIASKNHIKYMRETYKLDFFDDIVNHDYDNENDPYKRILMALNEIKKLHQKKSDIIEFYNKNQIRFENNKKIIESFCHDNSDIEFLQNLIDL